MSSEFNSMEDLVFSRSFRNWVLSGESPERTFWDHWIERNPDKAEMVKNARAAIYALHLHTTAVPADEIDEEIRKALIRLKDAPRYLPLEGLEGRREGWRGVFRSSGSRVLVVLALAIGAGGFFYYRAHADRRALHIFLNSHNPVHIQTVEAAGEINLPDGSLVRPGKGSKLYLPTDWRPDQTSREVFLQGEARFDIRRNPATPFYVYTDQVVIKVLGTSFDVSTFPADGRTVVGVLAGKVSVYREEDFFGQETGRNELTGVVVMPNQEVVYDKKEDRLHKTLRAVPEPLGGVDSPVVFERTPIRQVFNHLQEEFGIPIQFDEEALDSCLVTAVLGVEPYYMKLDQICKAIGGAYEVIDGNIVVSAVGCR
ncbi:MAG TPA: FecR domain-containing protein [Puia sp.]|nr:FecR domain-containing protein [Puia sp.]